MKSNVRGQSQLLIPLLVILTSTIVLAVNATFNLTNNSSLTGNFLSIQQSEENNFSIEVWANTSLTLESNQIDVKALLFLDNGTILEGQEIKFYLNDTIINSSFTDSTGSVEISFNSTGALKAVFDGNDSLFLNPSESVLNFEAINVVNETIELNVTKNETNATENETEENKTITKPSIISFGLSKDSIFVKQSLIIYALVENASMVIFEINSTNYTATFDGTQYVFNFTGKKGNYSFDKVYAFDNSGNFDVKSANLAFEIKALLKDKKIDIKLSKKFFKIGEKISLDITASDYLSNLLEQEKIKPKWLMLKKSFKLILIDPDNNEKEISFSDFGRVKRALIDTGRSFRPGLYKLKVVLFEGTEDEAFSEAEFGLGLVNINIPKSIYLPGENATIIVGAITEQGKRAYNASVVLNITSPSGKAYIYSTLEGSVENDGEGIYTTYHNKTDEIGNYTVHAYVTGENVSAEYETFFEVKEFSNFIIKRDSLTLADMWTEPTMEIEILPMVDAKDVRITEYLPLNFSSIKTDGIVTKNSENISIVWNISSLKAGEPVKVYYKFTTPHITPIVFSIGPLTIDSNVSTFYEPRSWTLGIVDVRYFFMMWEVYEKGSTTAVSLEALCRGRNYTFKSFITEQTGDDQAAAQSGYIQIKMPQNATFTSIAASGTYGWYNLSTQPYPVEAFDGSGGGIVTTCGPGTRDRCGNTTFDLNTSPTAILGWYTLRSYLATTYAQVKYDTDKLDVQLIDCNGTVDLSDNFQIFSPTGERKYNMQGNIIKNKIIGGHVATAVVPIKNNGSAAVSNINATLKLYDGSTELNWFTVENKTQLLSSLGSGESYTFRWHIIVPDDVDASKTYTANSTINYSTSSKQYSKDFQVYSYGSSTASPLAIFHTSPEHSTADTSSAYNNRTVWVCNYGDYNLSVNITEYSTVESVGSSTVEPSDGVACTLGTGNFQCLSRNISTSNCFWYNIRYLAVGDTGVEEYSTEVIWNDPETNEPLTLTDTYVSPEVSTATDPLTATLNITSVNSNTNNTGIQLQVGATADANMLYGIEMYTPPGIIPFGFDISPDDGYPIGSVYNGYEVRWTGFKVDAGKTGTNNRYWSIGASSRATINFQINTSAMSEFTPGGKVFLIYLDGYEAQARYGHPTARPVVVVNGTWVKTIRYYNNTPTTWTTGFPTTFGCGIFNTSFRVWNKGNQPTNYLNITEIKTNITVNPLNDIIFQNNSSSDGTPAIINSGNSVTWYFPSFDLPTSKTFAKYYNYTINITYQTNGTFGFQGTALSNSSSLTETDTNLTVLALNSSIYNINLTHNVTRTVLPASTYATLSVNYSNTTPLLVKSETNSTVINLTDPTTSYSVFLTRTFLSNNTNANLSISYSNWTAAAPQIRVYVNGNILGNLTAATVPTIFNFTNVSASWIGNQSNTTINITFVGNRTNITLTNLTYNRTLNVNVSINGNFLGVLPLATAATIYNFTNVSTSWINNFTNSNINVTYQGDAANVTKTNLTFFLSGPFSFPSQNYTLYASCGAALSVGSVNGPSAISQGSSFLINATVNNSWGPGNATNVMSWITWNGTGVVPTTGANSTTIGTLQVYQSSLAGWTIDTSSVTCGKTYRFTINANATENTTVVNNYLDVPISCAPNPIPLENVTVTPFSSGWGRNFTFNVTANYTGSSSNVNLRLYRATVPIEPWTLVDTQNYNTVTKGWQNITFNLTPTCSDTDPDTGTKTWYYKINATDNAGSTNTTTAGTIYNFTITKDGIVFTYGVGDNSVANRSSTQTDLLILKINDSVNSTALTNFNVTFYVKKDGSSYDTGQNRTSNSTGHVNLSFDPICTPRYEVGPQKWKAVVAPEYDSCYYLNQSSEYALTIKGDFNISFDQPTAINKTRGDYVPYAATIKDDCIQDLSGIDVYFNSTGQYGNYSCQIGGGKADNPSGGYYACNYYQSTAGWNSAGARQGWYNATINATKDYYWNNITLKTEQTKGEFYLYVLPVLNGTTASPTSVGWSLNRSYSINVTDDEADNVTVYLWQRSAGGTGSLWQQILPTQWCVNCNNTNKSWNNVQYNCSFVGSVDYKFNASDLDGNTTEASGSIIITNDNVSVTNITPSNGVVVNRTASTNFLIRLYDLDNASYPNNAQGKIWITSSGVSWDTPSNIYSNSTGYLIKSMGPSDWGCGAYDLGTHYWKGGTQGSNCPPGLVDNVTGSDLSVSFTLMGTLTNSISAPTSGINYTISDSIHFNGTVMQDGSCGGATGATVKFNITNGANSYICDCVDRGGGI